MNPRVTKQWKSGSAPSAPSSTVGRKGSSVECAKERDQKEGRVLTSQRCRRSSAPSALSSTSHTVRSVKPAKEFSTS